MDQDNNAVTGVSTGSVEIWNALCRQTGIIQVDSIEDLVSTVTALQKLKLPPRPNVAIVGGAGGGSVTMTDDAELHVVDRTVLETNVL